MAFKVIGGLLIAFGLLDMIGSWTGLDVWGQWIGVALPEIIWQFSAYIEIGIGYFLFNMGTDDEVEDDDAEPETAAE